MKNEETTANLSVEHNFDGNDSIVASDEDSIAQPEEFYRSCWFIKSRKGIRVYIQSDKGAALYQKLGEVYIWSADCIYCKGLIYDCEWIY